MRSAHLLSFALLSSLALSAQTYTGQWRSSYKVYGPAKIVMNGQSLSGSLTNSFMGQSYPIAGKVVNKTFTGTVRSNGKTYKAVGVVSTSRAGLQVRLTVGFGSFLVTVAR